MIYISKIIIPLITIIVIIYGLIKKIDIYDIFIDGVKEGLDLSLKIFPSMFAMIISVTVLIKSNIIMDIISNVNITLFPKEILPIAILRPISSSSSLMILNNILKIYGPDNMVSKIASIITGSTDTTIYIIGMYYASIKVKKIKHSLIVGLLADLTCIIISIIIINVL
jgi:spore maturation protein B